MDRIYGRVLGPQGPQARLSRAAVIPIDRFWKALQMLQTRKSSCSRPTRHSNRSVPINTPKHSH